MFEELLSAARFTRTLVWEQFLWAEAPLTRSLYTADGEVVHFDLEGRWQRASLGGRTLLRGLDGAVLERFGGPKRTDVRLLEVSTAHQAVCELLERARPGAPIALPSWSVARLLAEKERFAHAYRPVGIMPPDRYRSLVVQATSGCAYNGCLFCSLYKGQRYRVVPRHEVREHLHRVKALLGSGLSGRRGIFLGEANALAMPQAELLALFELLHEELPALAGNVASFVDAFEAYRTVDELAALRAGGLHRVFIGVESGHEPTLAALGKPATVAQVGQLVDTLKAAGLSVGVIFLAGLGEAHVEASARLVGALALDERDLIYVSPLVVEPERSLAQQLERRGLGGIDAAAEAQVLRAGLQGRAQVAQYDVRRWIYT
jgi:hypothetical protein